MGEDELLIECSQADLCGAAGYARDGGGGMRASVLASLGRLSGVRFHLEEDGRDAKWRLLAYDMRGSGHRKLRVALNPRTGACARADAQYVLLDLVGARKLGDVARLLHQRLSAWINDSGKPGKVEVEPRRVGMAKLMGYVWDDTPAPTGDALRQRRTTMRAALDELKNIGWSIDEVIEQKEMYDVLRRDQRV